MTVYPLLHELAGEPSAWSESTEYNESRMVTADYGESFAGTRPYRDGDSLKRIHWKQTIRTRELHTRQYEQASDTEVTILLDDQAPAIFLPGNHGGLQDGRLQKHGEMQRRTLLHICRKNLCRQ